MFSLKTLLLSIAAEKALGLYVITPLPPPSATIFSKLRVWGGWVKKCNTEISKDRRNFLLKVETGEVRELNNTTFRT